MNSKLKIYQVDNNYFEKIDTEDKAYFLGFIMADGCVFKIKDCLDSYIIKIKLNLRDLEILEEFKKYCKTTYKIGIYKNIEFTGNYYCSLTIRSSKMAKDLIDHGCIPRKSLILEFPTTVSNEFMHHFIRGYFDGDGCVSYDKKVKQLRFNIVGTRQFLEKLQEILVKNTKLNKTKISNAGKNSARIEYGGNKNTQYLYDYLYKNSNIFLKRKKEKFEFKYE